MWPWTHLAFGYVLYSLSVHARGRRKLSDGAVLALVVATQFPDVVDKTLAWVIPVFEHGRLFAHSLFVVAPALVVALAIARWYDRTEVGIAASVGYLSHLVGDSIGSLLFGGGLVTDFLLWPVVSRPADPVEGFGFLFSEFLAFLSTTAGATYLVVQLTLVGATVLLWVYDGMPTARYVLPRSWRAKD